MLHEQRFFFLSSKAIVFALSRVYGRSLFTGYLTNVINSTVVGDGHTRRHAHRRPGRGTASDLDMDRCHRSSLSRQGMSIEVKPQLPHGTGGSCTQPASSGKRGPAVPSRKRVVSTGRGMATAHARGNRHAACLLAPAAPGLLVGASAERPRARDWWPYGLPSRLGL